MSQKLTYEFIKEQIKKEGYTLLSKEYKNNKQKLECICNNGHKCNITWASWGQGKRCIYCSGKDTKTIDFIKKEFEREGYLLLTKEYNNSRTKLNYVCPNGHRHRITWNQWSKGSRCYYCFGNINKPFVDIKRSFESEGYVLTSTKYINAFGKLNYICPNGHKHSIKWNNWQQGNRCPTCAGKSKPSIEYIKSTFEKEHYILVSKKYVNNYTKLKYICSEGHKHSITWGNWSMGHRCPTCKGINASDRQTGQNSHFWKGGVSVEGLPLYNTYAPQIDFAEEVRHFYDEEGRKLLEVRCSKCGQWFAPNSKIVYNRIACLNGNGSGENRFYCSQECKDSCEIFGKNTRSYINPEPCVLLYTDQELQIWSQEVLYRADYKCEICGLKAEHAHHIQPKKLEPGLALDPENGLAVCKECHYKYGHADSCSTGSLASIKCNKEKDNEKIRYK